MLNMLIYAAIAGLLILGALVLTGIRRGWMRNGYFTFPAVILIVVGVFLAYQTLGGVLGLAFSAGDLASNGTLILGLNGITQLVIMLGGAILISRAVGQNPFAVFRLEGFGETPVAAYLLSIPIIFSAQIVGSAVSALWVRFIHLFPSFYSLMNKYESLSDKEMESIVTAHSLVQFVMIFLLVAIVPAFAEETMFRGFAQSNLERSGHGRSRPIFALIVASLLFATIHLSLFKLPGLLALGLGLGWMAYRTNNLFVGSLGHAANNGLIVVLLYLAPDLGLDTSKAGLVGSGEMSGHEALLILAQTVPFLALFLYLFGRVTSGMTSRHNPDREIALLDAHHSSEYPDALAAPETYTEHHDSHT